MRGLVGGRDTWSRWGASNLAADARSSQRELDIVRARRTLFERMAPGLFNLLQSYKPLVVVVLLLLLLLLLFL